MNPQAILFQDEKPAPCDVRLRSLAQFLGVRCTTLDATGLEAELDRAPDHDLCILASASTISRWRHGGETNLASFERLRRKARFLFLYGFSPQSDTLPVGTWFSDGQILDVRRFERTDLVYEVACSHPQLTKEFSGLSFGPTQNQTDFGFVCASTAGGLYPLVSIAGLPFWILSEQKGCTTFFLACTAMADIQEKTDGGDDVAKYFSRLLPVAMFLKWAFPNHCWHSKHRFANFIIDDPLLKKSYGYLNYQDLLSKMDENNFSTTIAFIPWNYRRTQSSIARLFRDRSDRLSLCIHGCDHTRAEFATRDLATLNRCVGLASHRMNAHRARTQLAHAEVMVFPQARFSSEALKALKCNNYLAAVNTRATPVGSSQAQDLTLGEFLEPAITRFAGFPLYLRRHPGRLERFALDLFFGNPLLVVEHHEYLKDGGRDLVEFIAQLNSFGGLEWRGLNEILAKTHLERDISAQMTACKLYSNSHVIENHSDRDRIFVLTKSHVADVPIDNIFVNGSTADFAVAGDIVQLELTIPAHTSAKIHIVYKNVLPSAAPDSGFRTTTRVWTRRMLSEFRDSVLWKSDFLMATAQALNHKFLHQRLESLSCEEYQEELCSPSTNHG